MSVALRDLIELYRRTRGKLRRQQRVPLASEWPHCLYPWDSLAASDTDDNVYLSTPTWSLNLTHPWDGFLKNPLLFRVMSLLFFGLPLSSIAPYILSGVVPSLRRRGLESAPRHGIRLH